MKKKKTSIIKKKSLRIAPILLAALLIFFVFFTWQKSVLIGKSDRINIVVYDAETQYFSIGLTDGIHYAAYLTPDMKVHVPGGYGEYRVGAVGKLTNLEEDPDIIRRTFSHATGSFVTLYFYPDSDEIYYGSEEPEEPSSRRPSFGRIMSMKTNGSLFDKFYISYFFSKKGESFKQIAPLSSEDFKKKYQGYFYYQPYRSEHKTIQIIYNNRFSVALAVSGMLEGTGINVSDITKSDHEEDSSCTLIEESSEHSKTALSIAEFFDCNLQEGETDIYDIIMKLGAVEKDWEVE